MRQVLTYEILADLIGMGPEGKGAGTLAQPLGLVMEYCKARQLPPLTVLVVNKNTGQPGKGLTTIQELHSDRERVFNQKWLEMRPPQVAELAQHEHGQADAGA
jgi:putative restriction endonuclease